MPTAGSPAKCQCCCVDRLCSRGENRGGPPPQGMEQPGRYLPGCFFMPPRKKPPLMLSGGQTVKGPRRVCVCGRKESPIIFFGDMCGEENTSRPANVRAGRLRRTARALQSGGPPFVKKCYFLTASTAARPDGRAAVSVCIRFLAQRCVSTRDGKWRNFSCKKTARKAAGFVDRPGDYVISYQKFAIRQK